MVTDDAIRALVRSAALATVELVAERVSESDAPRSTILGLFLTREAVADLIAEATFGSAEDDPEHELHAVRGSR